MFKNPLMTIQVITLVMIVGLVSFVIYQHNQDCNCEKPEAPSPAKSIE